MSALTWLFEAGLGYAQMIAATIGTVLSIGVAFLLRPGRATLLWACAFTLSMVSMFGVLTGELNDLELWRRVSLGLLMGVPGLLWSGMRAWWGERSLFWVGPVVAVLAAGGFAIAPDDEAFLLAYRLAFGLSALTAGAFFVEWVRVRARRDPFTIPFAVLSLAFLLLAVIAAVALVLPLEQRAEQTATTLRLTSAIGMIVYTASAILAVLGVALRGTRFVARHVDGPEVWEQFASRAEARLREAQATGETWSVLYLRLDDAADVRRASDAGLVSTLETRFESAVRDVFDAQAEVSSPTRGDLVVLAPQPDAVARELLRTALDRVTTIDPDGRAPIRPSASAGWAPASGLGYDFVALVYLAREASELATQRGGDRWERVDATVGQMLISRSARL